jgi:transitional endoplasmic reticulum ATPase
MNDDTLRALELALQGSPDNVPLLLLHADQCAKAGRAADGVKSLRRARDLGADRRAVDRQLVPLLRATGDLGEALIRCETLLAEQPDAALWAELARIQLARGNREEAHAAWGKAKALDGSLRDDGLDQLAPQPVAAGGPGGAATADDADWADQFVWDGLAVRLDDVVGLDDVKRQVRLRVLAPLHNKQVYEAFARKSGGGLLLYGPPGCGKTFLARAVAGEVGARFHAVSIHDLLEKWFGDTEKLVHELFAAARRKKPAVLFFDEFDAIGSKRQRGEQQFWKTLVNQLLVEMDGATTSNEGVLVVAATNTPWAVDPAFRRPGRFDRVLLVPPPDEAGRASLLGKHFAKLPGGDRIDAKAVARRCELFTGADLKALVERSAERALEASLDDGKVHPVTMADVDAQLGRMQSSAQEWIAQARQHAKYANEAGAYDDLANWLRAIKKW